MLRQAAVLIGVLMFFASLGLGCDDDSSENTNNTSNVNNTSSTNNTNNTSNTNNTNTTNNTNNLTGCTAPPKTFWNYDLTVMPPQNIEIPATCYGMGDNVYVYVADEAWADQMVTQEMVDDIVAAWEDGETVGGEGIYEKVTTVFGDPPDVDSDPHIIVFVTPLGSYNGIAFDGYFKRENEVSGVTSNLTEMVYIDCEHHAPNSSYLLGVLAHEFQHMIQYGIDPGEESWLDETFSQGAMSIAGYWTDLPAANQYLASHTDDTPLYVLDTHNYSYGAGFLFASYALDRFGADFFSDLSSDPTDGIEAMDNALAVHDENGGDFFDLILDWAAASYIRDCTVDSGRYCYISLGTSDLTASPAVATGTLGAFSTLALELSSYGYVRYSLSASQEVAITVDAPTETRVLAVYTDSTDTTVTPVQFTGDTAAFTAPGGDGELVLIVTRSAGSGDVTVTVQ